MSQDNLVKLMQAAAEGEQITAKLQRASSYEDVINIARENGLDLGDLSAEQAQRTISVVTGQITEELSEEELELVAGGVKVGNVTQVGLGFVHIHRGWAARGLLGDSLTDE